MPDRVLNTSVVIIKEWVNEFICHYKGKKYMITIYDI